MPSTLCEIWARIASTPSALVSNPEVKSPQSPSRSLKDKFRIDASDAKSKSWEEFKDRHLDFIVSVSEQAEETSHAFPDKPLSGSLAL